MAIPTPEEIIRPELDPGEELRWCGRGSAWRLLLSLEYWFNAASILILFALECFVILLLVIVDTDPWWFYYTLVLFTLTTSVTLFFVVYVAASMVNALRRGAYAITSKRIIIAYPSGKGGALSIYPAEVFGVQRKEYFKRFVDYIFERTDKKGHHHSFNLHQFEGPCFVGLPMADLAARHIDELLDRCGLISGVQTKNRSASERVLWQGYPSPKLIFQSTLQPIFGALLFGIALLWWRFMFDCISDCSGRNLAGHDVNYAIITWLGVVIGITLRAVISYLLAHLTRYLLTNTEAVIEISNPFSVRMRLKIGDVNSIVLAKADSDFSDLKFNALRNRSFIRQGLMRWLLTLFVKDMTFQGIRDGQHVERLAIGAIGGQEISEKGPLLMYPSDIELYMFPREQVQFSETSNKFAAYKVFILIALFITPFLLIYVIFGTLAVAGIASITNPLVQVFGTIFFSIIFWYFVVENCNLIRRFLISANSINVVTDMRAMVVAYAMGLEKTSILPQQFHEIARRDFADGTSSVIFQAAAATWRARPDRFPYARPLSTSHFYRIPNGRVAERALRRLKEEWLARSG